MGRKGLFTGTRPMPTKARAKGEHAFLVVKHRWGYRKVRYKGLLKNAAQVFSLFVLAKLYLVRKELLLMRG